MARLYQTGFEIDSSQNTADFTGTALINISTTTVRSGAKALLCTQSNIATFGPSSFTTGPTYARIYLRKSGNPPSAGIILTFGTNTKIQLNTDGSLSLLDSGNAQVGSNSPALSNDVWYRFEIKLENASGTFATARIDGTDFASGLTSTGVSLLPSCQAECPAASGISIFFDDFAANDSAGSANNSWCGAGKVVLLLPTSDAQRGSWTGGVGGTTNLYQAVDNIPPVGTASETDLTQIESADSTGNNATDEYRPALTTYSAAGIASGDTINALQLWICHGEDVSTGTKTGSIDFYSNPAGSGGAATFNFGDDGGLLGTYPSAWKWVSKIHDAPSVTLGTAPQLNLRKTDAGTRVASVCFMGVYVDYTPSLAPPFIPPVCAINHILVR